MGNFGTMRQQDRFQHANPKRSFAAGFQTLYFPFPGLSITHERTNSSKSLTNSPRRTRRIGIPGRGRDRSCGSTWKSNRRRNSSSSTNSSVLPPLQPLQLPIWVHSSTYEHWSYITNTWLKKIEDEEKKVEEIAVVVRRQVTNISTSHWTACKTTWANSPSPASIEPSYARKYF